MPRGCWIGKISDVVTQGTKWLGGALTPLSGEQDDCWRSVHHASHGQVQREEGMELCFTFLYFVKVEPVFLKILEFIVTCASHTILIGRKGGFAGIDLD